MDLLAGTASADGVSDTHQQMVEDMIRVFEAQRLVSLDTLFDLADNLDSVGKGQKLNTALAGRLAARISEIQLPRSALSSAGEELARLRLLDRAAHRGAAQAESARGHRQGRQRSAKADATLRGALAPFLRDTLVGFNYMHYAPPGAQVLHTNPLFVRSHDFIGIQGTDQTWKRTEVFGTGWPANAGGRLVGSLAALPYALAEAEQNFLIPSREQALIWGDLVPQMMLTRGDPALVERDAGADCTGWDCTWLRRIAAGRSRP